MDDLLPDGRLSARDLAEAGWTPEEIAAELELTHREVSALQGPITPAQVRRVEHRLVDRAVGCGDSLPHVQAQQAVLAAYMPDTYGRQAAAGGGTLRVIVDRGYTLRAGVTHDHGEIPALSPTPVEA